MAVFDLRSSAFVADPYPTYRQLLSEAPVYRSPDDGLWYVSRHADVAALLRHPRVSADYGGRLTARLDEEAKRESRVLRDVLSRMTLFRDPPAQAWLHRALARALTADLVAAMEPDLAARAERLLAEIEDASPFDVVAALAWPLPAVVMASMLGAPASDLPLFRRWSQDLARLVGEYTDAAAVAAIQGSVSEAVAYFRDRLRSGHAENGAPGSGVLLRALVQAQQRHGLEEEDALACCVMLVFAGHETTTSLIGSTLFMLLRHPDLLAAVRADRRLLPSAIEEALRLESPIQQVGRVVREELVLGGEALAAGTPLVLLLGAANRDPRAFDRPDRFDLYRPRRPHLAFGAGGHACPGGNLSLLEARLAIDGLLDRFEHIDLAGRATWDGNFTVRRLRILPVAVRRAA